VDWGLLNRGRLAVLAVALVALLGAASTPAASGPAAQTLAYSPLQTILGGRAPGVRTAKSAASDCGGPTGVVCSVVTVPLDRTGQVPGTIGLHVEVVPAGATPKGAVFLIAGGPGQGSAHVFGLSDSNTVALFRFLFPGYTLVAYDDRGTGESGLLDCPSIQAAVTADQQRDAATACAAQIGPTRAFYSTADHAEDLEAVRQALGFDKVALFGVSYGTKLAMAYALAHPDHVERLLLDSVLPPEGPDPYSANVLRNLPATLDAFCSDGGCRAATSSFSSDVVAVANALAAKPAKAKLLLANGKTQPKTVDGLEFLATLLDADLSPGLGAELPAVVHAARNGNIQPLVRLAYLHDLSANTPSIDLSGALYAATVCRDGPFPWDPGTPPGSQRQSLLQAAVAALPAGTFGPFGNWTYRFGNADFCIGWPSPAGGAALGAGPLPNVPVLAISGGFDMRTPTESAQQIVSRFPQGQLLVVPGVGHSVTTADPSGCAIQAIRNWMAGANVAGRCDRSQPFLRPLPGLPAAGPVKPKKVLGPLTTYTVALKTIDDAEAIWLMAQSEAPIPGVFAGKLTPAPRAFTLTRYSIAHGVSLSGTIRLSSTNLPLGFEGTITVSGPAASTGILGLKGSSLRGTLGGRLVGH
jgi:pimeloyl-ACP methyl ester carboxylesterase